jgi:pyruvate formate lyase activating enzyme
MEIKGFIENSLVDYDSKISAVVFLPNCNFRCGFCFNQKLVLEPETLETIPFERIEKYLKSHSDFVDAVTITGGEPCMHPELAELCRKFKNLGLFVKVDTNGSFPGVLKKLAEENLVDYIAMDIKGLFEDYPKITNVDADIKKLKESANFIMNGKIPYEFRITAVPKFINKESVEKIGQLLKGAKKVCLQRFRPDNAMDRKLRDAKSYTLEELQELAEILKRFIKDVRIRGA